MQAWIKGCKRTLHKFLETLMSYHCLSKGYVRLAINPICYSNKEYLNNQNLVNLRLHQHLIRGGSTQKASGSKRKYPLRLPVSQRLPKNPGLHLHL